MAHHDGELATARAAQSMGTGSWDVMAEIWMRI
jgi:hypothetical protein